VGASILSTVHRSKPPCPCHWIPPVVIARVHLSRLCPNTVLMFAFRPQICSPVVLSRKRPSFGPARGIRSLKPSAAYFQLCALALVRQRTFFCLSYPWMLKFWRLSLVCVHRIGYSAFPFFPGQRRRALMLARIIKVSCAMTLCRTRQHLSLSLHSTSHTRQPNAD
jgi:hypothetical protein